MKNPSSGTNFTTFVSSIAVRRAAGWALSAGAGALVDDESRVLAAGVRLAASIVALVSSFVAGRPATGRQRKQSTSHNQENSKIISHHNPLALSEIQRLLCEVCLAAG